MIPELVVFDLDLTLAGSREPIREPIAGLLARLLARTKVAVASGGTFRQLDDQVVGRLTADAALENLYLLPTSGAALYEYRAGAWHQVYEERLTDAQMAEVAKAAKEGAASTGLIDFSAPSYGERIELRGSEVTLSALGQLAPPAEKAVWDPTGEKREKLRAAIAPLIPDYEVKRGGSTSIDITKKGIDKAFGMRKLSEHTGIKLASMLYVGDELSPGGNDEIVKETGVETRKTADPEDTVRIIEELLA